MTIWYILYSFGTFFPVLVSFTKKNLAILLFMSEPSNSFFRKPLGPSWKMAEAKVQRGNNGQGISLIIFFQS
jgi:hypothetical protein